MIIGGTLLLGFILLSVHTVNKQQIKLKLNDVNVKSDILKVKLLDQQYNELLESKKLDQEKLKKLEEEKIKLEQDLQAKRDEEARVAAKQAEAVRVATLQPKKALASSVSITGNKNTWLRASAIPESEWWAVDYIISKESGWNPNATNKSSGAHGLAQALPYSKTGCGWTDAVCQLNWANNYAKSRYGSWAGAASFWQKSHWW